MTPYRRRAKERAAIAWRVVVNSYPCPVCPAGPGYACRTERGNPKPEPHAARAARAHARGWAHADEPGRCFQCHGPLPGQNPATPQRCAKCIRAEFGARPTHATKDNPGPDGSYDVTLWGEE
jgi:hypothetical protein